MGQWLTQAMWALPSDNEQSLGAGRTVTTAGTVQSREFMEFASFTKALFVLDVAALTGTTTLTVEIQGFNETSGKWHTVFAFPGQSAATAAGVQPASNPLVVSQTLDWTRYRAQWTTTGSGFSVTFTLEAIMKTEEPAI
jgi:hypothetical protein